MWALRVGDREYTGIDLRASAKWPDDGGATVDLEIYHPGPTILGAIEGRQTRISVLAGYDLDQGPVEIGGGLPVADSIEVDYASVDRPVRVQLSAARAPGVVLSASWGSISASEVIEHIRGELGVAAEIDLATDPQYTRYSISGAHGRVLDALAKDCGCRWQIGDGALRLWPRDQPRRITADVWSPATGLLTVLAGDKVRATAMLRPGMRPGDRLRFSDLALEGDVRATAVSHDVDTGSDLWTTAIEGRISS